MANINISQIRMKRGNTAAASTYVGPLGELLVDTGLRTIRIQDGVTAGGMSTLATNAQVQALGTYANTNFGTSSFGNANVELYLNSRNITSANIGAFQVYANLTFNTQANSATQAVEINSLRSNITAANAAITSLTSNAAIQAAILDTLTGNAASQATVLDTLTSNAATQSVTLSDLLSNAVAQQTSLINLVANATTQAEAIANATGTYSNANVESYIGANIGTLHTNAAAQAGNITTLQTQVYANANVATYLTRGNVTVGNITIQDEYDQQWQFRNGALVWPAGNGTPTGPSIDGSSNMLVTLMQGGNFEIYTTQDVTGNTRSWSFDSVGNLIVPDDATIHSDLDLRLYSEAGNIALGNQNGTWMFDNNGMITLPSGGTVTESTYLSADSLRLKPNGGTATQYLEIAPTAVDGDHIHLMAGSGTELFLGDDNQYVKLANTGGIVINSNDGTGNIAQWAFDTDGKLTAPGEVYGQFFTLRGGNGLGTEIGSLGYGGNVVTVFGTEGFNVETGTPESGPQWQFDTSGNLTLPANGSINYSNGASILSGIGNGIYGNVEVAAYLANFDGTINFTASPATISTGEITAANVSSTNGFFWGNGTSILNGIASQSYVTTQINNLVNNAPALLDTLGEIAANLATEANATGSILSSIANTNANVVAANVNIVALESNAASQQTSIDTLLGRVDQAVNTTSSPQFAGLTTTANVELTANVHIHQNLVVDGNINFIGNVTQTNITTANAVFTGDTYGFGALYAGVLGYTPLPYTVIQATADYNDYSQINFQNLNLSANASTEWVATAGNGSDLTNYIDFGIAGGTWTGAQTNSVGTAAKANDGWLYVLGNTTAGTGGNLVLGTIQAGKRVNILTGGPGSANIYSYFNSAGLTTANVYATNYLYANGVSILTGIGGTYSNTNVSAYLSGNISTGNINIGSALQLHGIDNSITTTNGSAIQFGQGVNFNSTTRIAVNGNILAQSGATSTSTGTGALQVSGGIGVTGSIYAGGTVVATGNIVAANYNFANGVNILSTITASSTYSNTNVSAYLTEQSITSANIGGSQTYANTQVQTINANLGAYQTFANANVSSIQNQIFASNANIGAFQTYANTQVQTINANLGAFQTYANATFGVSSYGNTQAAAYLLTYPNVNASILNTTSGNITTLRAVNFNSANAVISGGYISALTNASIITGTVTTLNSTNGNVTTLVATNFSTANAVITGGYATGLANITVTGNATVGNVIGVTPNVQLVAGAYTTSFLNNGMATIGGNISVSGNVTATGIAPFYAPNRPAFRVYGNTSTVYTAGTTISTQAIDYNQGGYYNNSTGIFTAPVPGLYHAYGTIRVATNNGLNQVSIQKNASTSGANVVAFWETDTNTGVSTHFSMTGYANMAAGDTLRLRVITGNVNFDSNDSWGVTYIG